MHRPNGFKGSYQFLTAFPIFSRQTCKNGRKPRPPRAIMKKSYRHNHKQAYGTPPAAGNGGDTTGKPPTARPAPSVTRLFDSRLSKSQVMATARSLNRDGRGIANILSLIKRQESPRVTHNAAWVLYHLNKEDKRAYLLPQYSELVDIATSAAPCFRRGLALAILTDIPTDEPDGKLLDFCLKHLTDPGESNSSRAAMINLAARMCRPYGDLRRELAIRLEMIPCDAPRSLLAARKNALKTIGLGK